MATPFEKILSAQTEAETVLLKGQHILVFTGHMIDRMDRREARFPASKEEAVRQEIKSTLLLAVKKKDVKYCGFAGGACGGDILFHEVCWEIGIATTMFLPLSCEEFLLESVSYAGDAWVNRFNRLVQQIPYKILSSSQALPKWMGVKKEFSIWERSNFWLLNSALAHGGENVTLIALWDRKRGDGPGGTDHMIDVAGTAGAKIVIIDINAIP